MRLFFTVCFCGAVQFGWGQSFLVPYKVGNKYGLSNEKAKLVVKPAYDHISWLQGYFFETSNEILLNDTLETAPHRFYLRNKKVTVKGILYKDKVLLKDEPYSRFEIVANKCIVAKNESRYTEYTKEQFARLQQKEKFISLFNLDGKNVYPDEFKRLQKFDTAGSSIKNKGQSRYILFASENFNKQFSLFVFDADRQDISTWLLKDVAKIKVTDTKYRSKTIQFEYTDESYNTVQKLIDYSSGQFVMTTINTPARYKKNTEESKVTIRESAGLYDGGGPVAEYRESESSIELEVPISEEEQRKKFIPFYQQLKDSLFYVTFKNERSYINLQQGTTVIFREEKSTQQFYPLIFKQNNRFGLLDKYGQSKTTYDSLVYFGGGYMAARNKNNRFFYGIISREGKETLQLLYDSIDGKVKQFELDDIPGSRERSYFFTLKEKQAYSYEKVKTNPYVKQNDDLIIIYKNGRAGLFSINYGEVIPAVYDTIAQNGLNYTWPRKSEFLILKKNGLYGITIVKFNRPLLKYEMLQTITPVFSQMPCYFVEDYYNIKGLKLYGLYNSRFEFAGYATENGLLFAK